ncbi:reverse transcriptase domain-containing protein [Tanacetum coccineum]
MLSQQGAGKALEDPSILCSTPDVSNPLKRSRTEPETSRKSAKSKNLENTAHCPPPGKGIPIFMDIPNLKAKENINVEVKISLFSNPYSNQIRPSISREDEKIGLKDALGRNASLNNSSREKLEDPGKFLIPCALQELKRTSALADSGASINLLPYSIYKKLELEALTPTRMTLELAIRSISQPDGN